MNRICNYTIDTIFSTGQWIWNHPSRIQTAVNLIGLATIGIATASAHHENFLIPEKIQQIVWKATCITGVVGHTALVFGSVFAKNSTYLKKIVIPLFDIAATALITGIASNALMPGYASPNHLIGISVFTGAKIGMQKYKDYLDRLQPSEDLPVDQDGDLPVPQNEAPEIAEQEQVEELLRPRDSASLAG